MSEQDDPSIKNIFRIAVRKFAPFEVAIRQLFAEWLTTRRDTDQLSLHIEAMDLIPLHSAYTAEGRLRDGTIDLAFVVTDWLAELVNGGGLSDVSHLISLRPPEMWPEGWSQSLLQSQSFGGGIWGLPFHDGPMCMLYRTDLLPDGPPETWEAFKEVARSLRDPEQGLYGTAIAAYADGHNTIYDFCVHLWTRGGELIDSHGRPTLDSSLAVEALDFYRQLVCDEIACLPGAETIDSVRSGELFMQGRLAIMPNWFGFASMCLTRDDSKVKGRVGLAPIPRGDSSSGKTCSLNVYWLLSVAAGSRKPELAYDFARFCVSVAGDKALTLAGGVGCRISTWNDSDVNALVPFFQQLPFLHQGARTFPIDTRTPHMMHAIENAVLRSIRTTDSTVSILREAQASALLAWGMA